MTRGRALATGVIVSLGLGACGGGGNDGEEARLLFSSGFEAKVTIDPEGEPDSEDYRVIRGRDLTTGFRWPIRVLGASGSALHYVDHDRFRAVESEIRNVVGHDGRQTRALYSVEYYSTGVTQCPYEILNIKEGKRDLYIRYWIKMDRESLTRSDMWRTFFEWKSKGYARGKGFRLIAFIYTDEEGKPYWHWQGDRDPEHPLWAIDNRRVPVPLDEWFLTEFYWHWSEGKDGRALWRVNGRVIGDHRGPTTRNGQPIDFIMLTRIYGDANPKHQWVDDIEIWDRIPKKYR